MSLTPQHPQGTFSDDTLGISPHPRNGSDHSHPIPRHSRRPSSPHRTPLLLHYPANVSWLLTIRPAWEVQSDSASVRGQHSEKRTLQRVSGGTGYYSLGSGQGGLHRGGGICIRP